MTTSSQSFSMKARKAGSSGPEAASHQPRSVAAAQVAASVSTPKTRTSGILVASAPASDAPMSPRPTTAMAEKGALGATGAGSFSVSDRQTRAFEAFVLKTSLTVVFPVYIIKVTSSLSACDTRLIFPPFKSASSSAADRRI